MSDRGNTPVWRAAIDEITPMNRVHAGGEMSEAYDRLQHYYAGMERFSHPSGSRAGSWEAPPAWTVKHARLTAPDGTIVYDWADGPAIGLYTYSPSFKGTVTRSELDLHLMSDAGRPDATLFHFRNQYRFWAPEWGFCVPHSLREALPDGSYDVDIETEFSAGEIEMVVQTHQGEHADSVLLVGHFDHPEQCADGLLGCVAGHEIISRLEGRHTRLTYRMLSTVEIVGSVFYAANHAEEHSVREALFCATSGAQAPLVYAQSFGHASAIDRAIRHALAVCGEPSDIVPFRSSLGNDEVAYDVEGVDIPCGSLMRWPVKEYHTTDDTPDRVSDAHFERYVAIVMSAIDMLENNATLEPLFKGLPSLSHPELDLYLSPPMMSGVAQTTNSVAERVLAALPDGPEREAAIAAGNKFFYLMNLLPRMANGTYTTLDIAEKSGVPFAFVDRYVDLWVEKGLIRKVWANPFGERS